MRPSLAAYPPSLAVAAASARAIAAAAAAAAAGEGAGAGEGEGEGVAPLCAPPGAQSSGLSAHSSPPWLG